ncbi:MAG: spermidine synthase, partial [Phycisphaerae bacterium]
LIRWIGTEVRIFAYLQNTVLVVCFLGLGLGCFTCRDRVDPRRLLIPLLILTALFAVPAARRALGHVSELLSVTGDFVIWKQALSDQPAETFLFVALGLGVTFGLMVLVAEMFVPLGRILGRLLDDSTNTIRAYSVNVGGSLLGIWGFVALSVWYQPPVTWVAVVAILLLPFLGRGPRARVNILMLAGCVALAWCAGRSNDAVTLRWSPYQKLLLREPVDTEHEVGRYIVEVNNTGYQAMIDLSDRHVAADPTRYPPAMRGYSQYDIPALLHPDPRSMLIVGAGSGNDAAGALRHGVERIVAVEIDPAIIAMGRAYHPERPYASPHVTIVNDDARSYFANCATRFDVISFGLLDSHTMTAMTNARLDHYVYTRESIEHARSLLADGGVMVLSFEAQKPYIADRMAGVLRTVFGAPPICFRIPTTHYGWGGVMFVAGDLERARAQLADHPALAALIANWRTKAPLDLTGTTRITTDDWPYIYLEAPRIPVLFFLLAVLMALLMLRFQRVLAIPDFAARWSRTHWHFFFLGAAFLLLEMQNISKASVVLGNTWWVSAVIISGVLAMILLANAVSALRPHLPLPPVYVALCGSCLALYAIDISQFAFLPFTTKAVLVGGLTTLPMFFAGIVFIRSFAAASAKHEALGANLLGALVGALMQSVTFLVGIKALLLIVAAFYVLGLLTRPRPAGRPEPAPEPLPA